jgi:hypothetical protein
MDNNHLDWYIKNILDSVTRKNEEEEKFVRKLDEINKEGKNSEKKK